VPLAHGRDNLGPGLAGATTWLTKAAKALASMTMSRYDERIAALRAALPSAYPPEA